MVNCNPDWFQDMSKKDAGSDNNMGGSGFAPGWCVHFRSMARHDTCEEGIGYTELNGGSEYRRMFKLPCFIRGDDKPGQRVPCERFKAPTVEENALHARLLDVRSPATSNTRR